MREKALLANEIIIRLSDIFKQEIIDFALVNEKGLVFTYHETIQKDVFEWFQLIQDLNTTDLYFLSRQSGGLEGTVFKINQSETLLVLYPKQISKKQLESINNALFNVSFFRAEIHRIYERKSDESIIIHLDETFNITSATSITNQFFNTPKTLADLKIDHKDLVKLKAMIKTRCNLTTNNAVEVTLNNAPYVAHCKKSNGHIALILTLKSYIMHYTKDIMDYLNLGIVHYEIVYDSENNPVDAKFMYLNKRYADMIEKPYDSIINQSVRDVFPNIPTSRMLRFFEVARTGRPMSQDYKFHAINKFFHVYTFSPNANEFINIYYETTAFHSLKSEHEAQLLKLKMMLDQAKMGFIEIDYKNKTLFADNFVHELFTEPYLNYERYREIFKHQVHPDDYDRIMNQNKAFLMGDFTNGDSLFRIKQSSKEDYIFVKYHLNAFIRDKDDKPQKIFILVSDVTKEEKQKAQIQYYANYDSATNLHNRRHLKVYTKDMRLRNEKSLVTFDVDGLKLINDVLGHARGDEAILTFTKYLKSVFNNDYIARIGGDEFLMLTDTNTEYLSIKLNMVYRKIIKTKIDFIPLSVSVGYTSIDRRKNFETLHQEAENMMYKNKLNKRSARQHEILKIIMLKLNLQNKAYKYKVKRLKRLAIPLLKALNYGRSEEVRAFSEMIDYHGIGIISNQVENHPKAFYNCVGFHSEMSYKIMINLHKDHTVAEGILHQCERFDGSGHPYRLIGKDIPLFSRVFSVVCFYDMLTETKLYRRKYSEEEALKMLLKEKNKRFDPLVVNTFIHQLKNQINNA